MWIDGAGCRLCPRRCGAKRTEEDPGLCGAGPLVRIARVAPHYWEEPCICNENGSGAVFFCGCSLGCVFCQNRGIALGDAGREVSVEELADAFLRLSAEGACNINLVTAGHYLPQVREALLIAKKRGLSVPVVYNTGSYECVEALATLEGLVDVYLPDYKYSSPKIAAAYSSAEEYPEVAWRAIAEMVRQTGNCEWDGDRLVKGTLVRLLLLPHLVIDAKRSLKRLFAEYGNGIAYSLMRQYTPMEGIGEKYPALADPVSDREYASFVALGQELGIEHGFTQEKGAIGESFIPLFDNTGV